MHHLKHKYVHGACNASSVYDVDCSLACMALAFSCRWAHLVQGALPSRKQQLDPHKRGEFLHILKTKLKRKGGGAAPPLLSVKSNLILLAIRIRITSLKRRLRFPSFAPKLNLFPVPGGPQTIIPSSPVRLSRPLSSSLARPCCPRFASEVREE